MYSKKDLEFFKSAENKFRDRLLEIVNEIKDLRGDIYTWDEISEWDIIEFFNGYIGIDKNVESVCGCCEETEYFKFPEKYMYEFDRDKYKEKLKKEHEQKVEKDRLEKLSEQLKKEEYERELLKELSEKYSSDKQ